MPNHVHLIAVPQNETGLARAIGEAQPHPKWDERPVALVVPVKGARLPLME